MKHLIVVIIFFTSLPLYGQSIDFGLKGGLNGTYIDGEYSFSEEDITLNLSPLLNVKYTFGGVARLNFTSIFSLQSELLYSVRGARFNEEVEIRGHDLQFNGELNFAHLELPLLFRISSALPDRGPLFYQRPGFTFNAYIGGLFGYTNSANFKGDLQGDLFGVPFEEAFENSVLDQFNDMDYSLVVGGGFEYGINTRFVMELRYVHGLKDIGNDPQFNGEILIRSVTVMMGVMF